MNVLARLKNFILGASKDPFCTEGRQRMALIAFLAWIGLGADGLSSSCYGPELGYLALGQYHHLGLYLAFLTGLTVFIIALSYNQVIELFPNGGGGYKVANTLLGPAAGLVSGIALLVDYLLTIAISIASGVEAVFSLLPLRLHGHLLITEVIAVLLLMVINLRGMKESIKVLLPIFLGFVLTHLGIILYGIFAHGRELPVLLQQTVVETHSALRSIGFVAVMAILFKAYSLGSGTYTGLEAVSNNVNMLAEPRVKTGRMTMLYMALSLSIVASGILLLYMLWRVQAQPGMTLNAVVFQSILGQHAWGHIGLVILLAFEAGLLVVGANTGYLGGPAVLANMAIDDWVPRRFAYLSSRLVKQNGILFFGIGSAIILILSRGSVAFLVILYSINVFVTFSISLLGLVVYWWQNRGHAPMWGRRLALSFLGFFVCSTILVITVVTKFFTGAWIALLLLAVLVVALAFIKRFYRRYENLKDALDESLVVPLDGIERDEPQHLDPKQATAVFLVKNLGAAIHTILWVERMFPKYFQNYIFMSYGSVDTNSFRSETSLNILKIQTDRVLKYLVRFANKHGIPAKMMANFGADPMTDIPEMAREVNVDFSQNVFFMSEYLMQQENLLTRFLSSGFMSAVNRRLQREGIKVLSVPLVIDKKRKLS